jgi:hypothetical protein
VTIHRDGRFTYYDPRARSWIERADTVPAHVRAVLPEDERARVQRALTAARKP